MQQELARHPRLALLGDFNVAPEDRDVHNPKRWEGGIHVSPPERAAFRKLLDVGLADAFRLFEQPEKEFSLVGLPAERVPARLGAAHRFRAAVDGAGEALQG